MTQRCAPRESLPEWLELCALATTNSLEPAERERLHFHLATCAHCRETLTEFQTVVKDAGPLIASENASSFDEEIEFPEWNANEAKRRIVAKLDDSMGRQRVSGKTQERRGVSLIVWLGLVASLIVTVGLSAYHLGLRGATKQQFTPSPPVTELRILSDERTRLDERVHADDAKLADLEKQTLQHRTEIASLRTQLGDSKSQVNEARSATLTVERQFQSTVTERDDLAAQLQSAQQAYQTVEAELTSLRSKRQEDELHYAALELKISDLNSRLHDSETRADNDSQYLASDRDIRELMGARQLYIADVIDVDQNGDRRKPFGRVFYTKGKSLVFYAFDLDRQPARNPGTYQAWAREGTDNAKPISLGIFYVDSEANRRWLLKTEDPKALAQINAVFVTVEPKGGSAKPTSKPFLYAFLRSALPNHP
jgi:hypothetical protein